MSATEHSQTPAGDVAREPSLTRDVPALARRVLIIGLDGATFDILNPMMQAGRMPRLARLVETGTSGILQSTTPPITPAAWTTFMTGKGPGRHGIVDFERYDVSTNRLSFNSTYEIRERTIWEILGEKGLKIGSVQVPMTYPPRKVNGFLITGFETPGTDVEFTWPPELKQEILTRWPNYNYKSNWKRKAFKGRELFQQNLDYIKSSFLQGCDITTHCADRYGWDVLMVLYKLVDNLQHKTWKYLDPRTAGRFPREAEVSAECFNVLDESIGRLADYARRHEATILIMSDHGHGGLDGQAQPNLLLKQWGYLQLKGQMIQARRRASKIINRSLGRTRKRFEANLGIEHDLVVDWEQTRACVIHAGMSGFLYISLKGRQPGGLVDPGDYENLRGELKARFEKATCPSPSGGTIHVFEAVHRPEELYNCRREDQPWMPDLLLVPHPGLAVVRKIRGNRPVRWYPLRRREGTHRMEGILIANGPGIKRGGRADGRIVDIAPTLLAALGLRVPDDMEGGVLFDLFERRPVVETEIAASHEVVAHDEVYSEKEKEALTRRLTELGYLE